MRLTAAVLSGTVGLAAACAHAGIPPSTSKTTITLSNHITACPDKVAREEELLVTFIKKVKKNEPGVLNFLLYLAPSNNSFLTFEKYAIQQAIDTHLSSSYLHELLTAEAVEGTKCAGKQVLIPLEEAYGFIRQLQHY